MADAGVLVKFSGRGTFTMTIPENRFPASTTMAELSGKLAKKLKNPAVMFLFIMKGTEGFVPTPDQTLESLLGLYGQVAPDGSPSLSICISSQLFQG